MKTKKCSGQACNGKKQDIKMFGRDKSRKDNLTPICKKCKSEYDKNYREKNKNKIKIYMKKYQKINKSTISAQRKEHYISNRDTMIARARRSYHKNSSKYCKTNKLWRENNPDKVYESNKRWTTNNAKKVSAYKKKWKENNKDNTIMHVRKRRAKKLEFQENYTSTQEQITRKAFYNKCFNCQSTDNLCIDHHRPLSKGNPLTLDNAVLLCKPCNSSKGAKNPEDFYNKNKCERLDKKLIKLAIKHQD